MENLSATLGNFLATYGLLAIGVIMLLKEIGVPVPVPSDLIMITAGVQLAAGDYGLIELSLALGLAMLLGGSLQFFLVRGAGREVIYRIGRRIGLTRERLDKAMAALQQRGPLAVFLGLNLPGARAGIIPAAGLSGMRYPVFSPAMLSGSGVFYAWHIALGYVLGPSALALLEGANLPILLVVAALAVLGLGGWLLLRRRRASTSALAELHEWTHAACPACLAIAAVSARSSIIAEKTA
ncbi:MAG: DedA family protein [Anaerolineales bacterium]